ARQYPLARYAKTVTSVKRHVVTIVGIEVAGKTLPIRTRQHGLQQFGRQSLATRFFQQSKKDQVPMRLWQQLMMQLEHLAVGDQLPPGCTHALMPHSRQATETQQFQQTYVHMITGQPEGGADHFACCRSNGFADAKGAG